MPRAKKGSTTQLERRALRRLRELAGESRETVSTYQVARAVGVRLERLMPALRLLQAGHLAEQRPTGWAPAAKGGVS
jgi:hypothetical protein